LAASTLAEVCGDGVTVVHRANLVPAISPGGTAF